MEAYDVTDCVDIMTDDTEFVNSNCKLCIISLPEASSSRYGFINMCMQYTQDLVPMKVCSYSILLYVLLECFLIHHSTSDQASHLAESGKQL